MKKLITLFTLGVFFSSSSFAEFKLQYIKQGDPAPYEGFVINFDAERQFRLSDKELQYQTTLNGSLEAINKSYKVQTDVMQERITNLQDANIKLADKVSSSDSMLSKLGMFILGAATATLVAFAAAKAVK